jgi:hypothetical protein
MGILYSKREQLEDLVEKDLGDYGQHNPCPLSQTILTVNGFRHYELGPCVGFLLIGWMDSKGFDTQLVQISEDDENWFYAEDPIAMNGYWTPTVSRTLNRMSNWYTEHIQQGFNDDWKWVSKLIKQPKEESIFKENGESACPVLGVEPQIVEKD